MISVAKVSIFLFFVFVKNKAEKTDLWDKCGCKWENWSAWSDCSAECNGQRSRSRMVWMYTNKDGCPFDFSTCATPGSGWDYSSCNVFCYNGGTSNSYSCKCVVGFYGSCCKLQINCGDPGGIQNGQIHGFSFTYNSVITYSCNNGFVLVEGAKERKCDLLSIWTGTKPRCAYYDSCSSTPCKNGAHCENVPDDYKCNCNRGWSGKNCDVDIQPPLMANCSSNIHRKTSDTTTDVQWDIPIFWDIHNFSVQVYTNYPKNTWTFPWGDFTVSYSATKPTNGMKTECSFLVQVRPHPCPELERPMNSALLCNDWKVDYGLICTFICDESFTVPRGMEPNMIFVCGATGRWMPSPQMPNCSVPTRNNPSIHEYRIGASFKNCQAEYMISKQFYIETIKKSPFAYFCKKYPAECEANNVRLSCPKE